MSAFLKTDIQLSLVSVENNSASLSKISVFFISDSNAKPRSIRPFSVSISKKLRAFIASCQSSGSSWSAKGLPLISLKHAAIPGLSLVPLILAPVIGGLLLHIAVVIVQPRSLKALPTKEVSNFWPFPVFWAFIYAAKIPPKVSIAQLSSATEATPVLKLFPGIEYASAIPLKACPTASVPGKCPSGASGP